VWGINCVSFFHEQNALAPGRSKRHPGKVALAKKRWDPHDPYAASNLATGAEVLARLHDRKRTGGGVSIENSSRRGYRWLGLEISQNWTAH
jgi:hypothetical protein